jgi:2-dehydropantoate 2-reductase
VFDAEDHWRSGGYRGSGGSPDQRQSMGQDMAKGRRTEIEYLNGFVGREGG